ncbi:hypothetical protein ScPMuIL_009227 [Solemya velum]
MPQGSLPVLEIDGRKLSQSTAIARYIGRQCGLMGKTGWEQAQIDCVLDTCAEITIQYQALAQEQDIIRKKNIFKNILENIVPANLDYCERLLSTNNGGKGHLVGASLSLADLALYDYMDIIIHTFGFKLVNYPKVAAHRRKIAEIPRVAEYLKKRPQHDEVVDVVIAPAVEKCKKKHYKLTYFNFRGFAELARMVFAASGTEYEDCRVDRETEWPKLKPKTPQGQLPVLEVNGEVIAQSGAIARFLAKEAGMMGETNWEQGQIEMATDVMGDIFAAFASWFREKDETLKEEKRKKTVEETIPTVLSMIEKMLTNNPTGQGFMVGSSLTLADLALYDGLQYPIDMFNVSLDNHPKIAAHRKMIAEIPNIAGWLKQRPVTEF